MSRLVRIAAGVLLATSLFTGGAHAAEPLKVDAATQRRLGVATAPLAAAHRHNTVAGFAKVIDPAPLAVLESDIAQAVAAAQASEAEAARARALHAADATVSQRAVETAQAQARTDAAKLALLRRRLGLEWGGAIARLPQARRTRLVADLAAGRTALVRIDTASGQAQSGLRVATLNLGAQGQAQAVVLGPARSGDPRLQSPGLIAQVSGSQAQWLSAGLTAPASISTGDGAVGVTIPRAALLRVQGATYAYIRKGDEAFERRRIDGGEAQPDGLFAAGGFKPGEPVVVAGAAALYAAETPAKAEAD